MRKVHMAKGKHLCNNKTTDVIKRDKILERTTEYIHGLFSPFPNPDIYSAHVHIIDTEKSVSLDYIILLAKSVHDFTSYIC